MRQVAQPLDAGERAVAGRLDDLHRAVRAFDHQRQIATAEGPASALDTTANSKKHQRTTDQHGTPLGTHRHLMPSAPVVG